MSAEDHRTPAEGMPRWVPLSVDLSVPAFDEIVNPDAPHESAPAPQTPAPEVPASQPTLPQENHASRGRGGDFRRKVSFYSFSFSYPRTASQGFC